MTFVVVTIAFLVFSVALGNKLFLLGIIGFVVIVGGQLLVVMLLWLRRLIRSRRVAQLHADSSSLDAARGRPVVASPRTNDAISSHVFFDHAIRSGVCAACGFGIEGVPEIEGAVTCPECSAKWLVAIRESEHAAAEAADLPASRCGSGYRIRDWRGQRRWLIADLSRSEWRRARREAKPLSWRFVHVVEVVAIAAIVSSPLLMIDERIVYQYGRVGAILLGIGVGGLGVFGLLGARPSLNSGAAQQVATHRFKSGRCPSCNDLLPSHRSPIDHARICTKCAAAWQDDLGMLFRK
ncbi:MAG: hypothetical protein AAFR38_10235 [Planctomycetota bacterium]